MRGVVSLTASLAAGVAALIASPAGAATIAVDTTSDQFGQGPRCSLREAVETANENQAFGGCRRKGRGAKDTVRLHGGRTYERTLAGIDDTNAIGDLDVEGKLRIGVAGQGRATIDAADLDRGIEVLDGARLTGARLVIANGLVTSGQPQSAGGGILNSGRLVLRSTTITGSEAPLGFTGCPCGGAIYGQGGAISLTDVSLIGNTAEDNGGGIAQFEGRLKVVRSTIAGNTAGSSGGIGGTVPMTIAGSTISDNHAIGPFGDGGGINVAEGPAEIVNSTISGNDANRFGGGIESDDGAVRINAVTVTANTADADGNGNGGGGGIAEETAIRNSIVAGNTDLVAGTATDDCAASQDSPHHNLVGIGTGCLETGSNRATADPLLKQLADNGGPTETHALRADSPAIDRAANDAPARDQRSRRRDAHPDIGAFER
jgi:CSLREA domain-containing protein